MEMKDDNDKPLDLVAQFILTYLTEKGTETPVKIARALGESRKRAHDNPDSWRRFLAPVKQQMIFLARRGQIQITRKGEVVDPDDFRGVVKLRLKN